MDNSSRYEVRNPEIEAILKTLGEAIRAQIPTGWVFALFIASTGEGGSTFYLSSAERETMLAALKEFIARSERRH